MTDNLAFLRVLLTGYIAEDERGLPHRRYLTEKQETEARAGLVALLRSGVPVPQPIREALADLFEGSPGPENRSERVLRFAFRQKGQRRDEYRDSEISDHVLQRIRSGDPVESAIASAVERFAISRSSAFRIWERHKPIYAAMGWLRTE